MSEASSRRLPGHRAGAEAEGIETLDYEEEDPIVDANMANAEEDQEEELSDADASGKEYWQRHWLPR